MGLDGDDRNPTDYPLLSLDDITVADFCGDVLFCYVSNKCCQRFYGVIGDIDRQVWTGGYTGVPQGWKQTLQGFCRYGNRCATAEETREKKITWISCRHNDTFYF